MVKYFLSRDLVHILVRFILSTCWEEQKKYFNNFFGKETKEHFFENCNAAIFL